MKKILPFLAALILGALIGYFLHLASSRVAAPVAKGAVVAAPSSIADPSPESVPDPSLSIEPLPSIVPTPVPMVSPEPSHILMYHYVRAGVDKEKDPVGYGLSVSPTALEAQIVALKAAGYESITMAEYAAGKGGAKSIVLTFDDGYADFYSQAYPILKRQGWAATVYVISDKIGGNYMTWDQIREVRAEGIEVGSHTVSHPDLAKSSASRQREEIFQSKAVIERELGTAIESFCYPAGKYTEVTEALVKEAGYLSATTTKPGSARHSDDLFELKRIRVTPSVSPEGLVDLLKQG